jgi:hypothetical protein
MMATRNAMPVVATRSVRIERNHGPRERVLRPSNLEFELEILSEGISSSSSGASHGATRGDSKDNDVGGGIVAEARNCLSINPFRRFACFQLMLLGRLLLAEDGLESMVAFAG